MKILLLFVFAFASCTTTTTTSPDGTVTSIRSQDPKAIKELGNVVGIIGAAAARAAIDQMMQEGK